MPRAYAFFFHYNKAASLRAGRNKLTVHYRGVCHIVNGVELHELSIKSRDRAKQPRCVLVGRASELQIIAGIAHLR